MRADGLIKFPAWIERSGLPRHLAETTKSPHPWWVLRKIVELDMDTNRIPGTVEASLDDVGALVGLSGDQVGTALKKLRKAGAVRSFLPDNTEEPALFQVVAPLPTPTPWRAVREAHADLRELPETAFRYAEAGAEAPPRDGAPVEEFDTRLREVTDLYLGVVSMKMNTFVLDELWLIATRFDMALIRKAFARARAKQVQSLAWILKEIRVENKAAAGEKPGAAGTR